MDAMGKPLQLNAETQQLLDSFRGTDEKAPLFGVQVEAAEIRIKDIAMPMLEGSGMGHGDVLQYWWFLRELCRLYRTRSGTDLAFHVELVMRKWLTFGLEPNTMQFLVCETWNRLKVQAPAEGAV